MSARNSLPAAAVLCVLAGCAVGPDFVRPRSPAVTHYSYGGDPNRTPAAQGTVQQFAPGAAVAGDWWNLFQSPALTVTVQEALANNPGLEAAQASLRESEDSLRSGYGIFFPSIDAGAAASRQRSTAVKLGEPGGGASVFNLFTLSASVSYVLDVFGHERRSIEALHAQVDLQRAAEQATYIALIANIVNTVIARAAYRAEIDATQELIQLQHQQIDLAQVQVRAGMAPYSTVLSLQSQLATYEATIPQLQQKLVQSEDLLATLAGHVPAQWRAPPVSLAELILPRELPVSLPSTLVHRRPDILIAEAAAHTASANVGIATADLFPSITLSGGYSANGPATNSLLSTGGRAWNVGGNVTAPLFEGGTLWYRRKASLDTYEQTMASYRQTVLGAFAQVADTLQALDHDATALQAQDEAASTAKEALHLVQTNYQAGLATYLEVLAADVQYHQAVITDLQLVAVRYQDTVALYVAVGGGWWTK